VERGTSPAPTPPAQPQAAPPSVPSTVPPTRPQAQPAPVAPPSRPPVAAGSATPPPAPPPVQNPAAAAPPAPTAAPAPTPSNIRKLDDFRNQRRETRDGNRTIIQEPGRTIVREGDRTFIRRNETERFRDAPNARTERRGANTVTVIPRAGGIQILTETDPSGRLLRRYRRDANGREVVIIDNRGRGPRASQDFFVRLPPPVIRIPRERYILEADRADEALIYDTLIAPPVERLQRRYTLDEIRYSPEVRARMPRIDIDTVNFDTGSWDVTPDQGRRLAPIAGAINRAVRRNPNEVFLVEGHTDAVGSDIDNLSLSDRRAESVAVILSEAFGVPPENLVTQGYGEEQLKVPTDQSERQNRRVTVRRITPLLAGN
jgi:outer membrane protein OmpA-like peptidoglycan-associated protein